MSHVTRRGFMKAASLMSLIGIGAAAAQAPAQATGRVVTLGLLATHPVGKTKLYMNLAGFSHGFGIIVTRTGVNSWVAFDNTCLHNNNVPVMWMNGNTAVCTQHGWRYDAITGMCTGGDLKGLASLRKYAISAKQGKVYATIA